MSRPSLRGLFLRTISLGMAVKTRAKNPRARKKPKPKAKETFAMGIGRDGLIYVIRLNAKGDPVDAYEATQEVIGVTADYMLLQRRPGADSVEFALTEHDNTIGPRIAIRAIPDLGTLALEQFDTHGSWS